MKYLPLISRILVSLIFVLAGAEKAFNFNFWVNMIAGLHVPLPIIATMLVITVEVPVALAFAYGYKKCLTGGILVLFTVIASLLVHTDWSDMNNMVMFFKNLSIVGGILAIISNCDCGKCPANKDTK